MKLEHEGVTYYSVYQMGCDGCAFKEEGDFDRCPQKPGSITNWCISFPYMQDRKSAIFLTEDEYLKRRLKGEV